MVYVFFFFKQKTAYEMRISDWSSDVCSSDLWIIQNALGGNAKRDRQCRSPVCGQEDAPELAEDQIYWKVSGIQDAVRWELGSIMMTWTWQVWIVTVSVPSSVSIRSISCSPIEQKSPNSTYSPCGVWA